MRVVVRPATKADERYRAGRKTGARARGFPARPGLNLRFFGGKTGARARGFPARPGLNLRFFGGKTIRDLTYTNVYLGGKAAWEASDIENIDRSLAAAMSDPGLNNVLAQYYPEGPPTATFEPSRILDGPLPQRVFRNTIEGFAAGLDEGDALSGYDLESTAFCFFLPRGTVLVDGDDDGLHAALREHEATDSLHGLGGYHGSIHLTRGTETATLYYAVGVYSEGDNGIPAFPEPWKSICATFYHELCEVRTDPDVEDAIRAGDSPDANRFLGWYSPEGGEVGDIPLEGAADSLDRVFVEVTLASGATAPVQLMWSNAVGGPEGPIASASRDVRAGTRRR